MGSILRNGLSPLDEFFFRDKFASRRFDSTETGSLINGNCYAKGGGGDFKFWGEIIFEDSAFHALIFFY